MSKILIKYMLIIYIFFSIILKKTYVLNTHISRNLNASQISIVERILIGQGIKNPVTSSWQLLLILLSSDYFGLSITHKINEFFESKNKIEENLAKSSKFYLHPAMNISSSVLIHPKSEFLDFIFTFIDVIQFTGNSNQTNISMFVNGKRNLVACNSMIKKMVKGGFVLESTEYETMPRNQPSALENSMIVTKNYLEYSIDHFCKAYLENLAELLGKLAKIKKSSINNLYSKIRLYNKICKLLDSK
ncbi:uncharacterized protein cubi_01447 [Cryptosporidium ubiquitum]|uniref:Uncharacterized protein n=1 Tax=Cryptosporidium ubiquitum TaxID=857276 RepID=A0A1J4MD00_9CRYT|nr:uncharacterized protein cubi_01447 [Cryptosporidium ubiquitum]OII72114.1 hypothetical protein cubi_01447 [Cryptosporidium ubiquitum]